MTAFTDLLDRLKAAHGIRSDSALASRIKLPQSTVTRWRHDVTPQPEQLHKIAEAFGLNVLELFVLAGHLTAEQAQLQQVEKPIEEYPPDEFAREAARRLSGGNVSVVEEHLAEVLDSQEHVDIEFQADQMLAARHDDDKPDPTD